MNDYGSNADQLAALQGLTPEQRQALIRGEWTPERMAALNRSSAGEQARLQDQLNSAQQMVSAPIQAPRSSEAGVVVPTVLANVLRTFGGALMADKKGRELGDAQARSANEMESLIRGGESATDAVKRLEEGRLRAQALRQMGQGYGNIPQQPGPGGSYSL